MVESCWRFSRFLVKYIRSSTSLSMVEKRYEFVPYFSCRNLHKAPFPAAMSPTKPKMTLLFGILYNVFVKKMQFNTNLSEHLFAFTAGMIAFLANYPFDPCVYNHFGARRARRSATIHGAALNGDAKFSGLYNRVLLGMGGALAVLAHMTIFVSDSFHLVANFVAMRQTLGSSGIARNQNLFIPNNDAAHAASITGRARGDSLGNFHEIFVPSRTNVGCLGHKNRLAKSVLIII